MSDNQTEQDKAVVLAKNSDARYREPRGKDDGGVRMNIMRNSPWLGMDWSDARRRIEEDTGWTPEDEARKVKSGQSQISGVQPEQAAAPETNSALYIHQRIAELRAKYILSLDIIELCFLVDQRAHEESKPASTSPNAERELRQDVYEMGRKDGFREGVEAAAKVADDFAAKYDEDITEFSVAAVRIGCDIRALTPALMVEGGKETKS